MSQFPNQLDSDADLPRVDDNITEIGADAINALRSSMFAVEANIGIGAAGSTGSIAQRLSVSIDPSGHIIPSSLAGIGLVTLPITDAQISPTAGIEESKLNLTFTTSSLFNLYTALKSSVDVLNGFLSLTGIKLEPHIDGIAYNHLLSAILIDATIPYLKTNPIPFIASAGTSVVNRTTTNAALLVKDISDDLVIHEKSDGSPNVSAASGGTVPPLNYGHNASGIYLNPSTFSTIPQTNNDVQKFAEFVDSSSLLLLGSRTQNLFSNGISRTSRNSVIPYDGYGEPLVPPTSVIAYLLNVPPGPIASSPVDDFNHGDDIVLFQPTAAQLSTFNFDAQFAQVQPGDLLTINYGVNNVAVQYTVDSKKAIISGLNRTYAVRISGKNLFSSSDGYGASARIDRPLFHVGKFGVLAAAIAPNFTGNYESLIIANPRSAAVLGIGFRPSELDANHYNLYLTLLPGGDPTKAIALPAIDVTGNQGTTPGEYTLDSILSAANTAFREPGFNYRFIAFQYQGQFGIMLADPYNNACFSIVSGTVDTNGNYTSSSLASFPFNVVDNFNSIDPLGLGQQGANVASPPIALSYSGVNSAFNAPSLVFYPLKRNFYYTNGAETDRLRSDPVVIDQIADGYGDGYWPATILPPPASQVLPNRVKNVYQVNLDLSTSGIAIGKTIVVQPAFAITDARYNFRDYGRFTISDIALNNCGTSSAFTTITVYDAVHGAGISPAATSVNIPVNIYFSDDSVTFNAENVFDGSMVTPFKRFFEVYVNQFGHTFTHERARFLKSGTDIANINLYNVSPKLRGYPTNNDKEIRLLITSYDAPTGIYDGYLGRWNPSSLTMTNLGPLTAGKKGEKVRFYDETNIDYIDFIFTLSDTIASFALTHIDIQLFSSLQLDEEVMLLASCQVDDSTKSITYLKDGRQFGNTSEKQFSTSAIDFINATDRLLRENGIINGFDLINQNVSGIQVLTGTNIFSINGGSALVNGKIVNINNSELEIPVVNETFPSPGFANTVTTTTWFLCGTDGGELVFIASTDFDPLGGTAALYNAASLDHNRVFYVRNPNSPSVTPYPIRATYFENLVMNFRDVVPLYVVTATTSGGTISSASVADIRRFVSNGHNTLNDALVLGPDANFRNFISVIGWITLLTKYNSAIVGKVNTIGKNVKVKGNWNIGNVQINLDFPSEVIFEGDDATFTVAPPSAGGVATSAIGFQLGNNITLKNIRFDCQFDPIAQSDGSYINAQLANTVKGLLFCNVNSTTGNKNIKIENCSFTSNVANRYPFITFNLLNTTCTAENISIIGNKFTTTATTAGAWEGSVAGEDKLAVIVFSGPNNSPGSAIEGARLINCVIDNNSCNKNQLIEISSALSGSFVNDMIATVGCKITRNVCGAINFLVKEDIPFYPPNVAISNGSFFSLDKTNGLIISDNTCRYIYSGTSDGFIWQFAGGRVIGGNFVATGIFTGPAIITRNSCSWIHTGVRISTNYTRQNPMLTIKDNRLNAFDASFLNSYYRSPLLPPTVSGNVSNTAVIVDRITGS